MKLTNNIININLPPYCNVNIWQKKDDKTFIISSKINNKKYNISIKKKNELSIWVDKWGNSIIFEKNSTYENKLKIENIFKVFLKSINVYSFKKIKFKGKGFRIKILKKNKIIKFYFGKSHITLIWLKKILKKRINKYKFILKSINKKNLNKISKKITNIKIFNHYTLRGLRLSRQIIFKRKGKKGTYI